ncbi:MAG: tol-pal system protein YbgF [Nitrosomonadales bacterium]|nr:tol-pal system protein YbgF [Nitrosomonadales bacterium]
MIRLCALMLLCLAAPAQAGLFADDEARARIQQLEARTLALEDAIKEQVKSMLDLQGQIEALNTEIRKLRGQNEEIAHGLQDAEKRQKDFYVDLDSRLRHFETAEEAAREQAGQIPPAIPHPPAVTASADPLDPAPENRAFEFAYGLYRGGSHADAIKAFGEFLQKYPDSVHVSNAHYWLAKAQFAAKDYKGALATYQDMLKNFPGTPKAADAYFNMAESQRELKQKEDAQKTFRQLIAKYPDSEAAAKARKLLAPAK